LYLGNNKNMKNWTGGVMAFLQAQKLECERGEEDILRRLGGAVALHWKVLPPETKLLLLAQAIMVVGEQAAPPQLEQQIEDFLAKTALKE
jgi:hypothetical protein